MPIGMCEFGTPVDCTFRRGHEGFNSNITQRTIVDRIRRHLFWPGSLYRRGISLSRSISTTCSTTNMLYASSENKLDIYTNDHRIQLLYRTEIWRSWRTAGLPGGLRTWSWMQDGLKDLNYPTLAWIAGPSGDYTAKDHHFSAGQKFQKQLVLINEMRQPEDYTASWTATVGGQTVGQGQEHGTLAVSEIKFIPFEVTAPDERAGGKADGQITMTATIGQAQHQDTFAFRVFGADQPGSRRLSGGGSGRSDRQNAGQFGLWHPRVEWFLGAVGNRRAQRLERQPGDTGQAGTLCAKGWPGAHLWPGSRLDGQGHRLAGLSQRYSPGLPRGSRSHCGNGLLMISATGPASSTLIEAYPKYEGDYLRGDERDQPYAGWHWGNQGGVSSAAIEKPHLSGWRPLLECEFDLAYSPLMELDYGRGRVILCTLDLEDHVGSDPAARRMAGHVMDYALHSPLSPRAGRVVYLGGATGAAWLDKTGVSYQKSDTLDNSAGLVLIGADATVDAAALNSVSETRRQGVLPAAPASRRRVGYDFEAGCRPIRGIALGAGLVGSPRA